MNAFILVVLLLVSSNALAEIATLGCYGRVDDNVTGEKLTSFPTISLDMVTLPTKTQFLIKSTSYSVEINPVIAGGGHGFAISVLKGTETLGITKSKVTNHNEADVSIFNRGNYVGAGCLVKSIR